MAKFVTVPKYIEAIQLKRPLYIKCSEKEYLGGVAGDWLIIYSDGDWDVMKEPDFKNEYQACNEATLPTGFVKLGDYYTT